MRFALNDQHRHESTSRLAKVGRLEQPVELEAYGTKQLLLPKSSMKTEEMAEGSVHLIITSPPYFEFKLYSRDELDVGMGNIHELEEWFDAIDRAWRESIRMLAPRIRHSSIS